MRRTISALFLLAACSGPSEPPCVEDLPLDCMPQYDPPTYVALFTNILNPTCASGTGTCHTSDARMGGLVFEDADEGYGLLLDGRVLPGDPKCSLIIKRLTSDDPDYRMPPGDMPLSEPEICTFTQWILTGASR